MPAETHFVQTGDAPILIGSGDETLSCRCGHTLIQGFAAVRFLAIGIQCARCGEVTTTPPLPEGELPPRSAIVAAPSAEPRLTAMTVPPDVSVVGQSEMGRLQALFQPATPDYTYRLTPALLDEAAAVFALHTGATLPDGEVIPGEPFAGLRDHALGWAVRHLRWRMRSGAEGTGSQGVGDRGIAPWACLDDAPTANAVCHVTGFLHFVATWKRHPLFPAMVATAADRGFSLHGLAPFAAAHCMTMMGNRINFPEPLGYPGRIEGFNLVAGLAETVGVHVEVFDRFEFPFGEPWDAANLRAAIFEAVGAAQGRINLRHPGMLLLSPGTALAGYDEALIEAIKSAMQSLGRKNRGLLAAAPIVLRLQALADPQAVRFGYGLFPIANRHYHGSMPVQVGA
ncbi:MAG TPA: hypothetical protein VGC82_09950 [Rhodopila sp.]